MKKQILLIALTFTFSISFANIICTALNTNANNGFSGTYKLDVDGDGVKDFWFHVETNGSSANHYIVGKNGSEVEVDESGGLFANKLSSGNQIGNNFWNDTAYLKLDFSGNFVNHTSGYVGLRFQKNGNYYYCWVQVDLQNGGAGSFFTILSDYGYNNITGSSLQAGQCTATSINEEYSEKVNSKNYPNPFSDQLTFTLDDNQQTTISLYNFQGQQVLQHTFSTFTTINTVQLASGIYFYELRSNKKTLKTGKIVKQ